MVAKIKKYWKVILLVVVVIAWLTREGKQWYDTGKEKEKLILKQIKENEKNMQERINVLRDSVYHTQAHADSLASELWVAQSRRASIITKYIDTTSNAELQRIVDSVLQYRYNPLPEAPIKDAGAKPHSDGGAP